jgi:4-diphosphocytidyl-2-C-methyl-D-erythritol kinase
MTVAEPAPAKLNLYLHVIGRRPDGYHLLDSLVAFADIGDEIRAAPASALALVLAGPFAQALPQNPEDNLVWRAALLLARRLGRSPNAALTLIKNLPVASGIGGGSSDAAAALKALLALWGGTLDRSTLAALAARLGADVPVCLEARAAWLGGIGDAVEPAPPLPATCVVLANPGIALPTPAVYQSRRGDFSARARFAMPADAAHLAGLLAERRNDLTEAAIALVPEIATALARLAAEDGALLARMSGSGATCFALFAAPEAAAAAAARLRRDEPRWWIAAGQLK